MESTGSTSSKVDKKDKKDKEKSIPKDCYKFIPSIGEQSLGEKSNRKKL